MRLCSTLCVLSSMDCKAQQASIVNVAAELEMLMPQDRQQVSCGLNCWILL